MPTEEEFQRIDSPVFRQEYEKYLKTLQPTVQVVNESQLVRRALLSPEPPYSRVVSVALGLNDDGVWRFAYTGAVGQDVRLLGVKVWVIPRAVNAAQNTQIRVRAGSGVPGTLGSFVEWSNVLPLTTVPGADVPFTIYDGINDMEWTMKKLYQGQARRFGINAMRGLGFGDDVVQASFHISEG